MPVAMSSGVEIDFCIWSEADVLQIPLALEAIDRSSRRGHTAAVEQLRVAANAYQPASGFVADERPRTAFQKYAVTRRR
jgi:hypothetical protein